ncbi:MAG: DMT family transporter [Aliiglaciecola sp.]|uniref:DMT family transporter n=1 Tax=Aliiglaciecola sp. TaxID=1872441 RepID=UPI003299E5F8
MFSLGSKTINSPVQLVFYICIALLAFAGNSILCRLALADSSIDATSFTLIRLMSGAVMLCFILLLKGNIKQLKTKGSWPASLALFIYAAGFSYAYIELDTGVGALILFACVQITMLIISWYYGARLTLIESLGVFVAFAGFIYLVSPGVNSPSILGVTLMACAGIAWGCYSIIGSRSATPLIDTSSNFLRASLICLLLVPMLFIDTNQLEVMGVVYALASGMLTSGVGYAIWYKVLPHIRSSVAAVLQLSVPAIAAIGGLLLLDELLTLKMLMSSGAILGGIGLVIYGKQQEAK